MTMPPIFVVGTGRCGSTMVSQMLRKHPAVLSLSEFFSCVSDYATCIPRAFPTGVIDAAQFWSIIGSPYPKQTLMDSYASFKRDTRFRTEKGVPILLRETLPHITKEYDAVFAEMETFVASLPPAPIEQHYQLLFAWLQQRFEREIWIERSGGSLEFISYLQRAFPDAKFVFVVRDGRDTVISASKHYAFRLILVTLEFIEVMGVDPFESNDRSNIGKLSNELRALLPECFDVDAFMRYNYPLSLYGNHWSRMMIEGLRMLSEVPAERVMMLRYEDFQDAPEATVRRLISFVGPSFIDEDWIHEAASTVRPARSSWQALPSWQQKQLNKACQRGFEALSAHHLVWS